VTTGKIGRWSIPHARLCSCSRVSYPGDGVTVGGAALAGTISIEPPRRKTANRAKLARFMSSFKTWPIVCFLLLVWALLQDRLRPYSCLIGAI
jgi:hypothetical protein